MRIRRIKFVWGAGDVIRGHWYLGLFGLYDRLEGEREGGLAISMRGLLRWGAAAASVAYVAAMSALFGIWQRNPYNTLTYADALMRPIRRAEVRVKQGQMFLAQGTDAMHAKRYAEAETLLRQGIAYFPEDVKARLLLAQFYVLSGRRALAMRVLEEGMSEAPPDRIFLTGAFAIAEQGEDFDFVARVAERYAARLASGPARDDVAWLRAREFSALIAAERFAEALTLARAEPPGDSADEHRVLALLGTHRPEEALAAAAAWDVRPGADHAAAVRLRARALREAGNFSAMEAALDELQRLAPIDPRPRVYGVVQRAMAGRHEAARAALEDFIFRFGGTLQNLRLAITPLGEIGQLELVMRVAAAAAERGYASDEFQAATVQAALQAGQWAAASRALAAMKPTDDRSPPNMRMWREWTERLIAATGPGETTGPALVEFLHRLPWPVAVYRVSVETLRRADRSDVARDAAAAGVGFYPASAWLEHQRAELVRLGAEHDAAVPSAVVAEAPRSSLGERPYWQGLEALLDTEKWDEAERAVREARTAKPPPRWLLAREGDLRWAQVRIARGRGEPLELVAACKLFLNGDAARAQQVLALGEALAAAGDRATAITLAKEILRTTPDFAAAPTALRQWSQPPPPRK